MINILAYAANTPECVEFTIFDDNLLEGDSSLMWEIVDVSPQIVGVYIDPNFYEFMIVDNEGKTVEFYYCYYVCPEQEHIMLQLDKQWPWPYQSLH